MRRLDRLTVLRHAGFTLIEVMVVIVIIGVIINFAVISFRNNSPASALKDEAKRFSSLVELAAEEALLRNQMVGIQVMDESYQFLLLEDESWNPVQETVFRERQIPESIEFSIVKTATMIEQDADPDKRKPNIILFSTGEMTPFEIKISSTMSEDYFRLIGTEVGKLTLDNVSL